MINRNDMHERVSRMKQSTLRKWGLDRNRFFPLFAFGFLSFGARLDLVYFPMAKTMKPQMRVWCIHWSLAAGTWQNGGPLCRQPKTDEAVATADAKPDARRMSDRDIGTQ